MRLGPPPTPARVPRTLARPSSTGRHCTWRPMSANVSRTSSAIACSDPVKLGVATARLAQSTSRSLSIRTSVMEVWEYLLAEEPDLLVPRVAPELEHDVRATRRTVLLDRCNTVRGRACDRLAAIEERVGHFGFRGESSSALHRLGDGSELRHLDPGELEQRVCGASDVLELVGEVHPGDLPRALAAGCPVALVDRSDEGAADVDVSIDVLARVADERRGRDRRGEAPVSDLPRQSLHPRGSRRDIDGRDFSRRLRVLAQRRDGCAPRLADVLELRTAEHAAHDRDCVSHRP